MDGMHARGLCSSYRESGELLRAPGAQQTEEDQQRRDAHPVAASKESLQIAHGPKIAVLPGLYQSSKKLLCRESKMFKSRMVLAQEL